MVLHWLSFYHLCELSFKSRYDANLVLSLLPSFPPLSLFPPPFSPPPHFFSLTPSPSLSPHSLPLPLSSLLLSLLCLPLPRIPPGLSSALSDASPKVAAQAIYAIHR